MRLEKFYENPSVLHVNTEPDRSYFVPCTLEGTEKKQLLSGTWDFKFYKSVHELENFLEGDFDFKGNTIPVPACIQYHGYDIQQYTNVNFAIPYDPPYVPDENPCGLYRTTFNLEQNDTQRKYLNFEGVDSCFYVWLNGSFVGYSQVTHATSEFDITDYAKAGENKLFVVVLKWCDGTYLEDQDKFRMTGIIRDVYILSRPGEFVRDYRLTTDINEDYTAAKLNVELEMYGSTAVTVNLKDAQGNIIDSRAAANNCCSFNITNPILWNAEKPYLYTVELLTADEKITDKVGVRKIEVVGNVMLLNGKKFKIKGVNRHESSPYTGSAVSREYTLAELKLMKENNINAIRTSHYPDAPWFLPMCDEMGFYVIGESDIESHGCGELYSSKHKHDWMSILAKEPSYEKAIVDRIQKNVIRDKNRTCVIIWSLGNESGYGENFIRAAKWIRQYDPTRLVHYESATWEDWQTLDLSVLDMVSRMYASTEWVEQYCENENNKKPFVQCEFCHAMGNGPGDLEDNYEQIYKYDNYVGGFVWEWCDHAIYAGKTEDGKEKFLYGGDHGEFPHDGNFCMDGLVRPDRTPHVGLLELKNVARPVRVVEADFVKGEITFENKLDFTELKNYLSVKYEIKKLGKKLAEGMLELDCAPHAQVTVSIKPFAADKDTYFTAEYVLKQDDGVLKAGHLLGFDQLCMAGVGDCALTMKDGELVKCDELSKLPLVKTAGAVKLTETELEYIVLGDNFEYTFSRVKGMFTSIKKNGKQLLAAPAEFTVMRAPTDNDVNNIARRWKFAGYDNFTTKVYDVKAKTSEGAVSFDVSMSFAAVSRQKFMKVCVSWTVLGNGEIMMNFNGDFDTEFPYLPRLGLELKVSPEFKKAAYFGYGPNESYIDKHRSSRVDFFEADVADMFEDYVRPQENGSHYACRYAALEADSAKLEVSSTKPFCFGAYEYTTDELMSKAHNFELEKSDFITWRIDYAVSGVGSNSCGPELKEKYRLTEPHIEWKLIFKI